MIRGVLAAESLLPGAVLTVVPLRATAVARRNAGDARAGQPALWTLLDWED